MAVKHASNCRSKRWHFLLAATGFVFLMTAQATILSQSPIAQSASRSDPNAVAIVHKAIAALGGEVAWQSIGGATAQVVETRSDGRTTTVHWSDDWHLQHAQFRRDATNPNGQSITMLADQSSHSRTVAGQTRKLPREEDITVLAAAYPAAALMLSLHRNDCALNLVEIHQGAAPGSPIDSSGPGVAEDCRAPDFPTGVRILWQFSPSTGLPIRVRLPVREYLHDGVTYQTARFDAFSQSAGVTVPSTVTFIRGGKQDEKLAISGWSFGPSLPASTFTASSEQQP